MKRTNLFLDEQLLEEVTRVSGERTYSRAVTRAIEDPPRRSRVVLVDTSVWIEVFRKPSRLKLESVVELDDIVTCLPVLQGFLDERAFRVAREAMFALPVIESPLRSTLICGRPIH